MLQMGTMQDNLAAMAKELDTAQRKHAKKGSTSSDPVDSATSQWEAQAPYVFEQLQALDESRVNHLRDALTQLQTHEIDCVERSKVSAESALNALLSVETSEEISTFIARTSAEIPVANTRAERSRPQTSGQPDSPAMAGFSAPPGPPPSRGIRDRDQTMSNLQTPSRPPLEDRRSEVSDLSEQTPKSEKKSRFGGLKRLGTVMSGRRGKDRGVEREKSPDKREFRKSRFPLRRNSSAMQQLPSPMASTTELPANSVPRQLTAPPERPSAPAMPESSTNGYPAAGALVAERATSQPVVDRPAMNGGMTTNMPSLVPQNIPQIGTVRPPSTIMEEGHSRSVLADIEQAQQEANAGGDDPNQFKVDIRKDPIHEEDGDAQAAISNVTNALRSVCSSDRNFW